VGVVEVQVVVVQVVGGWVVGAGRGGGNITENIHLHQSPARTSLPLHSRLHISPQTQIAACHRVRLGPPLQRDVAFVKQLKSVTFSAD
jgi:hypothetical protein